MNITKEKFHKYEKVRSSYKTNMWNLRRVRELTKLEDDEIVEIIRNYERYRKMYY